MGDFSFYTISQDYNLIFPDQPLIERRHVRCSNPPYRRSISYEGLQEGLCRSLADEVQNSDAASDVVESFTGYSKELESELEKFLHPECHKQVCLHKKTGAPLGLSVVESGWGNPIPTLVVACIDPNSPARKCNQLQVGDQILSVNGVSLVTLTFESAKEVMQLLRPLSTVHMKVVPSSMVLVVDIQRRIPGQKLGVCIEDGVIVSMRRGGLAERAGVRVGYRLFEINSTPVLRWSDEDILDVLATLIGQIRLSAMQNSLFRILTRKDSPRFV